MPASLKFHGVSGTLTAAGTDYTDTEAANTKHSALIEISKGRTFAVSLRGVTGQSSTVKLVRTWDAGATIDVVATYTTDAAATYVAGSDGEQWGLLMTTHGADANYRIGV